MKKLLLMLITAFAVFVSCEKSDADAIVGTWEATTIEMTMEGMDLTIDLKEHGISVAFTFMANGKGSMTGTTNGESLTEEFDYELEGGVLTLVSEDESDEIPVTIDGKVMVMTVDSEMMGDDSFSGTIKIHFKKK